MNAALLTWNVRIYQLLQKELTHLQSKYYQLWATKSQSLCLRARSSLSEMTQHSPALHSTPRVHLYTALINSPVPPHQTQTLPDTHLLTAAALYQWLTTLCHVLPAFLQSSAPDGAEQDPTFNILWKPELQISPLWRQKDQKVSLQKFKIILLTKRKSIW